jgi:hypothetical protein
VRKRLFLAAIAVTRGTRVYTGRHPEATHPFLPPCLTLKTASLTSSKVKAVEHKTSECSSFPPPLPPSLPPSLPHLFVRGNDCVDVQVVVLQQGLLPVPFLLPAAGFVARGPLHGRTPAAATTAGEGRTDRGGAATATAAAGAARRADDKGVHACWQQGGGEEKEGRGRGQEEGGSSSGTGSRSTGDCSCTSPPLSCCPHDFDRKDGHQEPSVPVFWCVVSRHRVSRDAGNDKDDKSLRSWGFRIASLTITAETETAFLGDPRSWSGLPSWLTPRCANNEPEPH